MCSLGIPHTREGRCLITEPVPVSSFHAVRQKAQGLNLHSKYSSAPSVLWFCTWVLLSQLARLKSQSRSDVSRSFWGWGALCFVCGLPVASVPPPPRQSGQCFDLGWTAPPPSCTSSLWIKLCFLSTPSLLFELHSIFLDGWTKSNIRFHYTHYMDLQIGSLRVLWDQWLTKMRIMEWRGN